MCDVYRMAVTYFEMKCVGRVCVLISISNCRLYNHFVHIPATYICVQLCFSLVNAVAIFLLKGSDHCDRVGRIFSHPTRCAASCGVA
mgnify:CR=1 FL=1